MNKLSEWPALAAFNSFPKKIECCESAVWGKVKNEESDFRWIARSKGFPEIDIRSFHFGYEDKPQEALYWLIKDHQCFVIKNYLSRSVDRSGRSGFLEKQILSWKIPANFPIALARLVLLPFVQREFNDQIWWNTEQATNWRHPDFYLEIDPLSIVIDFDKIHRTINQGIEYLSQKIEKENLVSFYAQILSKNKPSLFNNLKEPLPAEALAVLLLPLEQAEQLSIANWIQSNKPRIDFNKLTKTWDIMGIQSEIQITNLLPTRIQPDDLRDAEKIIVPYFLENKPDKIKLNNKKIAITETKREIKTENKDKLVKILGKKLYKEIHCFCKNPNRRWLDIDPVESIKDKTDAQFIIEYLDNKIFCLSKNKPEKADKEQWRIKIDLLTALAFVLTEKTKFKTKL